MVGFDLTTRFSELPTDVKKLIIAKLQKAQSYILKTMQLKKPSEKFTLKVPFLKRKKFENAIKFQNSEFYKKGVISPKSVFYNSHYPKKQLEVKWAKYNPDHYKLNIISANGGDKKGRKNFAIILNEYMVPQKLIMSFDLSFGTYKNYSEQIRKILQEKLITISNAMATAIGFSPHWKNKDLKAPHVYKPTREKIITALFEASQT